MLMENIRAILISLLNLFIFTKKNKHPQNKATFITISNGIS